MDDEISLIIFSKNRPLQLECLMRSIIDNTNIFNKMYVQYYSDSYFNKGYEILKKQFNNFQFFDESKSDFKSTFIEIFDKINGRICFMVDDNILFDKVNLIPKCEIFSLRLHKNISDSLHYNYPGSVDGNIFIKELLLPIKSKSFKNPNFLEYEISKIVKGKKMKYFDNPKLIGVPNNKVSETSTCRDMGNDTKLLNDLFLKGKKIDYKKMNLDCKNVHKYIDYIYC